MPPGTEKPPDAAGEIDAESYSIRRGENSRDESAG
jgi:hypothetical protein